MPALVVLAVSVYGLGTLSATVPRWIVIYAFAGIAVLALSRRPWRAIHLDPIDTAALCFSLWAAVSLLWSPDPRFGLYEICNWTALLAVFLYVRHADSVRWFPLAGTVAVVIALVLQAVWPWDMGGTGNRNFQTEVIILGLCLGWMSPARWQRALWLCVLLVAGWFLIFVNQSKIEWAVLLGLSAWYAGSKLGCLHPVKA